MRALTIHQPWAWAIAEGHKRYENRTWTTPYRGLLLIHAGRSEKSLPNGQAFIRQQGISMPNAWQIGCIVAVANLVAIHDVTRKSFTSGERPWVDGPYAWELADVRKLERPIPCAGKQGLWTPDTDVIEDVREQLVTNLVASTRR